MAEKLGIFRATKSNEVRLMGSGVADSIQKLWNHPLRINFERSILSFYEMTQSN